MDMPSFDLLRDAATRRLWLLTQALRCGPLDRAVELARAAEAFLMTTPTELSVRSEIGAVPAERESAADTAREPITDNAQSQSAVPERREQLSVRLARGGSNAQVLEKLALSARDAPCMRMAAAVESASPNRRLAADEVISHRCTEAPASPDDIVRYLRQQDDIVVPQPDGVFFVNARFRLGLTELVTRANRMRARQGKPEFQLAERAASAPAHAHPTNRHAIF